MFVNRSGTEPHSLHLRAGYGQAQGKYKSYSAILSPHLTTIKDTGGREGFDLVFVADPMRSGKREGD
jgi:hypothetical protein